MDETYRTVHNLVFCWICYDYHGPCTTGLEHLEGSGIYPSKLEVSDKQERKDTE